MKLSGNGDPRPILLVDVDGVLNPWEAESCPDGYAEFEFFPGEPVMLCPGHGELLIKAEAIGVNAPRIKRDIYMISAFLTALAGTFYVQYIYFIDPATAFSFSISIEAALVSIVGGIGTLWGPVIGTILLETTSTNLGNTVDSQEIQDLPLNGRHFTQLGTLLPGVAPMTPGLSAAGGSLRDGQAYAVNGQRPESNNFLIDGAGRLAYAFRSEEPTHRPSAAELLEEIRKACRP